MAEKNDKTAETKTDAKSDVKERSDVKSDAKTETKRDAKRTAEPLSAENWTPDIVASMLGMGTGLLLGHLLAIIALFGGAFAGLLAAMALFLLAAMHAIIYGHMELSGHRYFQQGYVLLLGTIGTFLALTLSAKIVLDLSTRFVDTAVDKATSAIPFGGLLKIANPLAGYSISITYQDLMVWTGIYSIAILLPFIVHSARRKELHFVYFLPLVIPAAIIVLLALVL